MPKRVELFDNLKYIPWLQKGISMYYLDFIDDWVNEVSMN